MNEDTQVITDKVTYRLERIATYANGEQYTDAKIFTIPSERELFQDVHDAVYGWLRSAFCHIAAPDEDNYAALVAQSLEYPKTSYDSYN